MRGAVTYLALQDEAAVWGYAGYFQGMQAREQLVDAAAAVGVSMFRELSGAIPDAVLLSSQNRPPDFFAPRSCSTALHSRRWHVTSACSPGQ